MPDIFENPSTRQTVPPTFDRRQAGFQAGDATVGTIPIVIFGEASQTALTTTLASLAAMDTNGARIGVYVASEIPASTHEILYSIRQDSTYAGLSIKQLPERARAWAEAVAQFSSHVKTSAESRDMILLLEAGVSVDGTGFYAWLIQAASLIDEGAATFGAALEPYPDQGSGETAPGARASLRRIARTKSGFLTKLDGWQDIATLEKDLHDAVQTYVQNRELYILYPPAQACIILRHEIDLASRTLVKDGTSHCREWVARVQRLTQDDLEVMNGQKQAGHPKPSDVVALPTTPSVNNTSRSAVAVCKADTCPSPEVCNNTSEGPVCSCPTGSPQRCSKQSENAGHHGSLLLFNDGDGFRRMLQSASRENRVTVLTASSGFVDFTLNLIISMRRVKVENFVIIAEDLACYQRLNGEFPGHVALSVSPESAQANTSGGQEPGRKSGFTYGTKNYNELVGRRPRYLL